MQVASGGHCPLGHPIAHDVEHLAQALLVLWSGLEQEPRVGRDERPLLIADVGRVRRAGRLFSQILGALESVIPYFLVGASQTAKV